MRAIAQGAPVRRYNQIIGFATQAIAPGQHVHTHNLAFSNFERAHEVGAGVHATAFVDPPATFMGIVRDDGRIATRNYIGVLTSVNCSATAARAIADQFRRDIHPEALADYPNVDGVVALTHGAGCATASDGEELLVLRRTLGGYARHANFAAVLVVGLGCETNQIQGLMAQEGLAEGARLQAFSIQDTGGTAKTVARGVELIKGMLKEANRVKRQPVPASHITVGPAVRRLRRLFGHQRQPGARCGGRSPGAPRRQRDPVGNARDLRRRAPADAPRGDRQRWPTSCSSASAGGRPTPRATTCRWTTTRRPATRPAG